MRDCLRLQRAASTALAFLFAFALSGEVWAKPQPRKPIARAAAASAKKKQKPHARAKPSRQTPLTEWELIGGEAITLRDALTTNPLDEQARQAIAELALRSARGAEHSLVRGDESSFRAYRDQLQTMFPDTVPGIARMAERGVGAADFALGVLALHGVFEARSVERACAYFAAAVEHRYGGAKFRHAQCIEERDPAQAARLMREAAEAGHQAAMEQLGLRCLDASPPDAVCATTWFERAAGEGRMSAKTLLGWMAAEGIGGEPDPTRAARLYREAAAQGEPSARNNLGELFEHGRGVPKNERTAFNFYQQAAVAGFAPAQFNLGRLHAVGKGTPKNLAEARRWFSKAARAGIVEADRILDALADEAALH